MTARHDAAALVAAFNLEIINAAAARRVGEGRGAGDRGSPSLSAFVLDLITVHEERRSEKDGRMETVVEQVTEAGMLTRVRRAPRILSRLDCLDGRVLACRSYAIAVERMGAVSGSQYGETIKGSGGASRPDGGAALVVECCELVRHVRAVVGGDLILPGGPKRQAVTALSLFDAIALHGFGMSDILRRAGWSDNSRNRRVLTAAAGPVLISAAVACGLEHRLPEEVAAATVDG